jgi:hypothetical protein
MDHGMIGIGLTPCEHFSKLRCSGVCRRVQVSMISRVLGQRGPPAGWPPSAFGDSVAMTSVSEESRVLYMTALARRSHRRRRSLRACSRAQCV